MSKRIVYDEIQFMLAMVNQLTDRQAENILDEYAVDRYGYPSNFTAKAILTDMILTGTYYTKISF